MSGLKFKLENQILFIEFLKPKLGNSFGEEDAVALISAIKKSRDARGVLWTSAHPSLFCSGGDLRNHSRLRSKAAGLRQAKKITGALSAFANWAVPKAVLVQGDCFGGGMELLSCFDFRVARPHVLFGFWQRRIGLSFGWGGFERWSHRVPAELLKELAFSARVFGSSEARKLGIIHDIGSVGSAREWLEKTKTWSPASGAAISSLQKKSEQSLFEKLWWTKEHRAVLRKF